VLAGTAGLTKTGNGTLTFTGTNAYSGNTTVSAGKLQIGDGTNATANAGNGTLAVGANTLLLNLNGPATLANSLVTSSGTVQNNGTGKVTLNNSATAFSGNLYGGTAGVVLANQITGGAINTYGDVTLSINNVNSSLNSWASGCTIHFVGTNVAWSIGQQGATGNAPTLDIASSLTLAQNGSGGNKYYNNLTGAGNFTFQGQSTQYGYVLGNSTLGGTLTVGSSSGNYSSGFSFGNGGATGLAGATTIVAYSGGAGAGVTFNATTDNTYSGNMSGTGGLIKAAANTLTLTGTNTYNGTTTISAGTLQVGNGTDAGTIASTSAITNNAALVYNVGAGNRTLAAPISGTGTLTKAGTGTLTLTGNSSYNGNTLVTTGTLVVNGTLQNSNVTVSNGATLMGSIISGASTTIQSGGTLNVGNSPGTGSFVSLTLNGTTVMEITGRGSAGIAYDTISVSSSLAYGGDLKLTFTGSVTNDPATPFNLFTGVAGGSDFAHVYIYAGASQVGTLTNTSGTWTGLADLGYGGNQQSFTFTQANGNLIVAVPEPQTWALLAFSLTTVMVLRRRRRD